jgi:thiamine biosynthesis lipoprotein
MEENKDSKIRLSGRQLIFPLTALLAGLVIWSSHYWKTPSKEPSVHRVFPIMGTMAEITLYGDKKRMEAAADIIQNQLREVEKTCNIFNPESEISQLNKTASEKPFKCGSLLWDILTVSRRACKISNGAFDITAKPLMTLWGFYRKRKELPSETEIKKALENVGLDKVIFNDQARTVKFTKKDLSFDLGGIAKGFAVDFATKAAREFGVECGIINLAGNMRTFPVPPPDRKNFTIGVRNPLNNKQICAQIKFLDTSIATSGNYERYVTINGTQYAHIMNPATGLPVKNMLSATVVTPLAVNADMLSTSIFIKGPEFAKKVCANIPGTHVLIIRRKHDNPKELETIKIGNIWGELHISQEEGNK